MPIYWTKFNYTPATWAKLIVKPEDRRKAAQSGTSSRWAQSYMGSGDACGTHDAYTQWEAPGNVSMAAVALVISRRGCTRSVGATVRLTVDETIDALRKAGQIGHRAPGA